MLSVKRLAYSPYVQAFLAGALAVLGFAPFHLFPVPILALAFLFWLWAQEERPARAAWLGFAFGMGLFCAGVGWIYVALHDYGYMHPLLAALATVAFAALISALPAAAGYAQAVMTIDAGRRQLLLMPACWALAEWLRGLVFTGFPWLALGYSQVPYSPLAGYAPVAGVFGVSLLVAVSAALLLQLALRIKIAANDVAVRRARRALLLALIVIWVGGALLHNVAWTQPSGEPFKVSLLQGNIAQEDKFSEDNLVGTLETYRRLAEGSDAQLIILPETAVPLLREHVPEYYETLLRNHARRNGGDMLIGVFEKEDGQYYNSVYTLGSAESQHYRKDHLVPFGEFIPLRSALGWLINEVLNIPMGDLSRGGQQQPLLQVAGQQVAVNICYEDAFGEEIIRALPQASLLVNVTNDAWYGESHAAEQHNQLSQMRALETGRMMLRATNTGVTSVIGIDGHVQAQLPQHEQGVLSAEVRGYSGSTPYVWWGNAAVLLLLVAMLGEAWRRRAR